jgi:hypothetical protein
MLSLGWAILGVGSVAALFLRTLSEVCVLGERMQAQRASDEARAAAVGALRPAKGAVDPPARRVLARGACRGALDVSE